MTEPNIILGVTGHRELFHRDSILKSHLTSYLKLKKPVKVLTGMALGFDQLVAEVCVELGIPFVAVIPYDGQEDLWSPDMKIRFYNLLLKAAEIVVVTPGPYEKWKLSVRNCWIVDHSTEMLNYMVEPRGGTLHCTNYAIKRNVLIVNLVDLIHKQKPIV